MSGEGSMKDACIEWTKYRNKDGYGRVTIAGRVRAAHRVSYCKHHGISLEEIKGKVVRHACDNPGCVNPAHLVLGTIRDNCMDAVIRGRNATKLKPDQVREIRARIALGHMQKDIAADYGVSIGTINQIHKKRLWTHVL